MGKCVHKCECVSACENACVRGLKAEFGKLTLGHREQPTGRDELLKLVPPSPCVWVTQICFGKLKGQGVEFPKAGNHLGLPWLFCETQAAASGSHVAWNKTTASAHFRHAYPAVPGSPLLSHDALPHGRSRTRSLIIATAYCSTDYTPGT